MKEHAEIIAAYIAARKAWAHAVRRLESTLDGLFPLQREVILDPARTKSIRCGRRAGKTFLLTRAMLYTSQKKRRARIGYITKTRDWSRRLVWNAPDQGLIQLNRRLGLGGKPNETRLDMLFPNASLIQLGSANDKSECEKFRGDPYDLMILDEAGSFNPDVLQYIVREILPAALGDYRGTLIVCGSPNPTCDGYFHDVDTDPKYGFKPWHWYVGDNPMFPRWSTYDERTGHRIPYENWRDEVPKYLAEERELYGLAEDDPAYLREYLGLWIRDESEFIYKLDQLHPWIEPPADLKHVLGIDLGYHDSTAFAIEGYSQVMCKAWEIETLQWKSLTFDDIKEKFERYHKQYQFEEAVVDTAGAGKILQETMAKEMWSRFGIPVKAAKKTDKGAHMRLWDTDIRIGRYLMKKDGPLYRQMRPLQWDKHRQREAEGQPCDMHDAGLYAHRECYHYIHTPPKKELTVEEQMKQRYFEQLRQRQNDPDWYGKVS